MVRWPGKVQPRRDEKTLVSTIDLAPTILAACGESATKAMTGINLLDLAAGKTLERNAVFGEIYEHDVPDIDRAEPGLMYRWVIAGDWKLIESADGKTQELYNLQQDPHEEKNLAAAETARVKALSERLANEWQRQP
jgi:uncharacterized sulfatase